MSARRKRELTREVGQRLERGAGPLVDLRAGFGRQLRALLDHVERCIGLELAGSEPVNGVVERRGQLGESVGHPRKVSVPQPTSARWRSPEAVERLVDERVGAPVLGARHVANPPAIAERLERGPGP